VRNAAEIQADLAIFRALLTQAGTNGIAEYSLDSGQGRQSVKRYTLKEIRQQIREYEGELQAALTGDGPVFITFDRGSL
jgi:hypothetical protein